MKGLILSAGKGTRLQPFSFTQPKTLLPVANKPVLQYAIEKLIDVGIHDIGIVIHSSQQNHLKARIGSGEKLGVSITYIFQDQPKGIADAVKQAETFINQEPFILLLGDNLIQEPLIQLKTALETKQANGSIMLAHVDTPQDYGIAEIRGNEIIGLEEKPRHPKSNMAVIGAYAFDPSIFKAIHSISASTRGEYEITDAVKWLIDHTYAVTFFSTDKHYSDVGNVKRWLQANQWMLDHTLQDRNRISSTSHIKNCTLIPPVIIGRNCSITNSTVGPYVSISADAIIEDCTITNSIVLESVKLSELPGTITASVFGQHSYVRGPYSDSFEYVLGDKSSLTNHDESTKKE